jgi:hypothetical protein
MVLLYIYVRVLCRRTFIVLKFGDLCFFTFLLKVSVSMCGTLFWT